MTTAGTGVCVLRQNSRKKKNKKRWPHMSCRVCVGKPHLACKGEVSAGKKTTTQICLEANNKNLQLVPIKLLIE